MIAKQRERKCATCRYYESSPLWRKGWCRNPLLYDPQTNHLVEADRLSCSRTFIDYWEPKEGSHKVAKAANDDSVNPRVAPSIPMQPTGPGGIPLRGTGTTGPGSVTAREQRAALQIVRQPVPEPEPPAPEKFGMVIEDVIDVEHRDNTPQQAAFAPTVVVPVVPPAATPNWIDRAGGRLRVGLIGAIIVGLLALGGINLGRRDRPDFLNFGYQPSPTPTRAIAIIKPTYPALTAVPTATTEPLPTATPEPPPAPILQVGGKAVVIGLNAGENLRVRRDPGTTNPVVGRTKAGTTLEIKNGPADVNGVAWWQVIGWDTGGTLGWVSSEFLQPVQ